MVTMFTPHCLIFISTPPFVVCRWGEGRLGGQKIGRTGFGQEKVTAPSRSDPAWRTFDGQDEVAGWLTNLDGACSTKLEVSPDQAKGGLQRRVVR